MNDANAIASALATVFNESERRYLADDPAEAVESLSDLKVELCDPEQLGEQSCGVAGLYLRQSKRILAARAMSHRRTKFTVLHEYGHHLAQHTLSSARVIAQTTPRWRQALFGERIADAFAAEILIPSSDVDEVLGGRQPTARDLAELFLRSNGSREACCVRISQRLNGSGYVILARGSKVLYCKPVGSAYSVRFGQDEGPRHLLGRASANGTATEIAVRLAHHHGVRTQEYAGQAVRSDDDEYVFAILTDQRTPPWGGDWRPPDDNRPLGVEGCCEHCDSDVMFFTPCGDCKALRCPNCGGCDCSRPPKVHVIERTCDTCFLSKRVSLFEGESSTCKDCA